MNVNIVQETCCNCNMIFWITKEHCDRLMRYKNIFYCPNGHPQSYQGKTEAQKIASLEVNLRYEKRQSESIVRSNSALRGVITKLKHKKSK